MNLEGNMSWILINAWIFAGDPIQEEPTTIQGRFSLLAWWRSEWIPPMSEVSGESFILAFLNITIFFIQYTNNSI